MFDDQNVNNIIGENEKINELINKLMSGIRHDLRGPLQVIKTGAYLIENNLSNPQPDPQRTAAALKFINESVDKAVQILEDLPSIIQKKVIKLADLTKGINNSLAPNVVIDTFFEVEEICVDPVKIRRVIDNLVKNAVEAMPNGGKIYITSRRQGDLDVIQISDNGPGIPEYVMETIFREKRTTKPDGHGIGLPSCRQIVEAHGGTISVKSEPGNTIFTISLPPKNQSPSQA